MPEGDNSVTLSGSVENITFRKEDTGFTVMDICADGELVTVVGVLPEVNEGEKVSVTGNWDFHASFGRQFRAQYCERSMPETAEELLAFLSSGMIKGVGPSTALKIVEAFGEQAYEILQNDPSRLATIKGISQGKAMEICQRFSEQFETRRVMIALGRFGMSTSECLRVYKLLGKQSAHTVETNPYLLCDERIGISFERASSIADALPQMPDDEYRLTAGVLHVFKHNLSNGHTCLPREKIYSPCSALLGVTTDTVHDTVDLLLDRKQLVSKDMNGQPFLFLPHIYQDESDVAKHIKMILRFPPAGHSTLQQEISDIELREKITYAELQRKAIHIAAEKGLLILTGGPGTGKTTALNGIIRLFEQQGLDVSLAAPTGRAAKRMSEVTGMPAQTIHRLLEVEWDDSDRPVFQRNERNPIDANALIVDELSMVDINLFASLLKALPIGCRLVLVGDCDQLPPVGAGNVLADMIASGLLPVVQLTEVFRQALESLIIANAHRIVRGEMPELGKTDGDFFFLNRDIHSTPDTIVELCAQRLPKAYGYSARDDIQVLCPSRKGETGSNNLNRLLQQRLNPETNGKREVNIKGRIFREGDKVMQIRNNYNIPWEKDGESGTGVFNGDIGTLLSVDMASAEMTLCFDGREAVYSFESAQELELAYAVTVHKSQGSEFEAVIMPAAGIVPQLTYRNLLYTAVTRAKSIMIIVGSRAQVQSMAKNDKKVRRFSALKYFLTHDDE